MLLIPQAIREGWDSPRLAREAGISIQVAQDVLAQASSKVVYKADRELGVLSTNMRHVAHTERDTLMRRLREAGSLCDRLQEKASVLLNRLGGSEKQTEAQELATLAGAVEKAARASLACWGAFKDASGLALAERVAEAKAKAEVKATGQVKPWDIEVIAVPIDE